MRKKKVKKHKLTLGPTNKTMKNPQKSNPL